MIDLFLRIRPIPPMSVVTSSLALLSFIFLDFMKERIKFHESLKIKIDLNHCLSLVSKSWFLSFLKECRLYSCGNVDGKPSAG